MPASGFSTVTDHRTALHITNRSSRGPHVYGTTSQRVTLRPGRLYRLAVWVRAAGLASNGAVSIALDPGWRIRPIVLPRGSYEWRSYAVVFDSGAASYVDLRIISEDVGEAWLTGFLLHEVTDVRDGVVHVAYARGGVPAHAFFFPPDQFVVAGGASRVHHASVSVGGRAPVVLVNGTFVVFDSDPRAPPPLPVGDFVLAGSDWRFDLEGGTQWIAGDGTPIVSLPPIRYHFGVTAAGRVVMAPGRVPPSTMTWAIGGLGGLLQNGQRVPLETSGSRLYNNIEGGTPLARSAIGRCWDGNVVLLVIGQGVNRGAGPTVAEMATEMARIGAADAALLDGGSATLAYHRNSSPPLIAPSSGYDTNWSFVGAVAGPNRVIGLPAPPSPRPPTQLPSPSFESQPRPPVRP